MRILISGATGLVGQALIQHLSGDGHRVSILTRSDSRVTPHHDAIERYIEWTPPSVPPQLEVIEGFDAFIHLAGEPIAGRRWTASQKERIYDSRITATRVLMRQFEAAKHPPGIVISASAVGYYGDTGEQPVDEHAAAGDGFTAYLCRNWESEALEAAKFGARVVLLRTGIVLSNRGGALARMLPVFRVGLGGRLGSGRQWMSWITEEDLTRLIAYCLETQELSGPVNAVSPAPVRNHEFTSSLARRLGRPALVPVPATALRLAYGKLADETLLVSQRVTPAKLERSSFQFNAPDLDTALSTLL